jgi:hypothetical protein
LTIQHRLIPDNELHEPKGAVSAALNTSYHATGAGSGVWKKADALSIQGLSSDGGLNNLRILTNGANGFRQALDSSYGVMGVTGNTANFAVTASADSTLLTTTGYALYTGTGAPLAGESLYGITFDTNKLTVAASGVYDVRMWANISGFPANNSAIGMRFRVNGSTYSPRTVIAKAAATTDHRELVAFGLITLTAGDYVQLYIASSHTGNLVIQNLNCTVELKRAL